MARKLSKSLRKQARKLGVRVTVKRNGKRVYKSPKLLAKQIKFVENKRKKKKRKSKRRRKKSKRFNMRSLKRWRRGSSPSLAQKRALFDLFAKVATVENREKCTGWCGEENKRHPNSTKYLDCENRCWGSFDVFNKIFAELEIERNNRGAKITKRHIYTGISRQA